MENPDQMLRSERLIRIINFDSFGMTSPLRMNPGNIQVNIRYDIKLEITFIIYKISLHKCHILIKI